MTYLNPLFNGTRQIISAKGDYQIQLEIPSRSSLTAGDIERIVGIVSWEGGRIDDKVDGYEGGRSVLITKERPKLRKGIALEGLQISGIGYVEIGHGSGRLHTTSKTPVMHPPSTENFMESVGEDEMHTSGVANGRSVVERESYAPRGAYLEERVRRKIENTRTAYSLPLSFSVPSVEAYGRYLDLVHDGQRLAFAVFTVPSATMQRFAGDYVSQLADHNVKFGSFTEDMQEVMEVLGNALRELHVAGYAHRQPHFSNFYLINDFDALELKLHMMDWSTMVPLGKIRGENATKRAIDLRIVHQNSETLCRELYGVNEESMPAFSVPMLERLMCSYFGKRMDIAKRYNAVCGEKEILLRTVSSLPSWLGMN